MLQQFLNHISRFQLGDTSSRTLLAVSGGMDSMVMLHLYHAAGFDFGVAHCNFQLRGDASDADEALVKETCAALGITFYKKAFNTAEYASEKGSSIQMAARELRYAWFDSLLDQHQFHFLATAHHLNDSIETVLLQWLHGGSAEGFTGVPVKNNRIIRPLLFASQELIRQYAVASNIVWREDQSNQSDDYERNYIRHHVIAHLKEINPSLEQTIQRSIEKQKGDVWLMNKGFIQWKSEFVKGGLSRYQIDKKGLQMEYAASVLWRFLRGLNFNFDVCQEIITALPGQSGKKFLSESHQLIVDRENLIVTPVGNLEEEVMIHERAGVIRLGPWELKVERREGREKSVSVLEGTLDAAKVRFPLRWRKWKAGDAFYPLGMENRKKISDYLIDSKVPVSDKDYVTVLESEGEIIWVVGHRIDHRFRITEHTHEVISFLVRPHFL